MTVDAIVGWSEVLAALAVIVSVLYLAYQIRLARLAAADASRHARTAAIRELDLLHVTHPEVRNAWNKACSPELLELDRSIAKELELNDEESTIVRYLGANWVWTHWAQYHAVKSPDDLRELENIVSVLYAQKPMSVLIQNSTFCNHFDPKFMQWVSQTLKKSA